MSETVKFGRSPVFFDTFNRRPGPIKKNMHYCPGCGHGILHKLVAEAIHKYGIQDKTMFIAPVGCAVFAYYYFNTGAISVPHGRAPAVGTGVARSTPDSCVISYQGDGDLAAIGFNEFIQAANRGEKMTIFFVNNSNYGMTGGQMAPTTLPGQKTTTTPYGRNVLTDGYPMKVCEIINSLIAPIYIERVALTTNARIQAARRAVDKAIRNLKEHKGFSFVEVLSPCPINLKMNAEEINSFIEDKMTRFFPIGCLRDNSETAEVHMPEPPIRDVAGVSEVLFQKAGAETGSCKSEVSSAIFDRELRIKVSGFGGQGVLSLGLTLANMGRMKGFNVSWMPSYGPEQRGGAASCSVIVSRKEIGSPIVDRECDLLVAMTQTALDKFRGEIKEDGILIYDRSSMKTPVLGPKNILLGIDSIDIAASKVGNAKCANSVLIGALMKLLLDKGFLKAEDRGEFEAGFRAAIQDSFGAKPKVVEQNLAAFEAGVAAETL